MTTMPQRIPPELAADSFLEAAAAGEFERLGRLASHGAVIWQNVDGVERKIHAALPRLRRMYERFGPWAYSNVRRLVSPEGVCEQHTVTFETAGGSSVTAEVCVVFRLGDDGHIVRIDEYLDSALLEQLSNTPRSPKR